VTALEIKALNKRFGPVEVLKGIDLTLEKGGFLVLVGPSGCGKSTLLNTIAGLESVTSGEIRIDGHTVNDLHPSKRDIAMVFQSYALYPHMTVYDNLSFGLKLRKTPKAEIDKRVRDAAQILGLGAAVLAELLAAPERGQRAVRLPGQRVRLTAVLRLGPGSVLGGARLVLASGVCASDSGCFRRAAGHRRAPLAGLVSQA